MKGRFPIATQEERLAALEQALGPFQREIARHIQETEENTTILLEVIRHQGQDIRRIFQHLETMDERLNTLEQHFNQLNTKSDEHTKLLTQILARLTNLPGTTS